MSRLLFFFFLVTQVFYGQDSWEYSLINHLNYFQWDKLDADKNHLNDEGLKHLIKNEITWWKTGEILPLKDSLISTTDHYKVSILKKLLLGNYFSRQKETQIKAFDLYKSGLYQAQQNQDVYLEKEIIFRLLYLLKKNSRGELSTLEIKEGYLNQLNQLITSSEIDQFRNAHLRVDNEMQKLEVAPNNFHDKIMQSFLIMQNHSLNNPILGVTYHRLYGIFLDVFQKEYSKAYEEFSLAKQKAEKISYHFIQKQIPEIEHSQAILLYREGSYKRATSVFEKLLKEEAFKNNEIAKMYTHDWLFKCYKQQGDFRNALHHFSAFKSIYERLDRRKHARLILKIESENKVKESQDQLRELKEKHLSLQSQFYLIVPILGISVLMIFFLYRIYKKSRKEVKKITQLVIKNHIVLKDKTKIYINDLLYIKAEDHYIRVYTSDGKNHLVRGKLGDIAIQLPPNFVRTHRSYITNRNFVRQVQRQFLVLMDGTEIPISRNFQKQWT